MLFRIAVSRAALSASVAESVILAEFATDRRSIV
jgi:hypothetical protein